MGYKKKKEKYLCVWVYGDDNYIYWNDQDDDDDYDDDDDDDDYYYYSRLK